MADPRGIFGFDPTLPAPLEQAAPPPPAAMNFAPSDPAALAAAAASRWEGDINPTSAAARWPVEAPPPPPQGIPFSPQGVGPAANPGAVTDPTAAQSSAPGGLGLSSADYLEVARRSQGAVGGNRAAAAQFKDLSGQHNALVSKQAADAQAHGSEQAALTDQVMLQQAESAKYLEEEAARMQADAAERARQTAVYQQTVQAAQKEADQVSTEVDPDRMLRGGRGVVFGLAAALGAFGSALAKTPNFAVQIIENALDRDFDAQRETIRGNQQKADRQLTYAQTLLSNFRQQGMDDLTAKTAARGVIMGAYANQVDAMTSKKKGAEEKAAGTAAADAIRARQLELQAQAAAMAARPKGKAKTQAEVLKEALDLEKSALTNDKLRAEAAGELGKGAYGALDPKLTQGALGNFQNTLSNFAELEKVAPALQQYDKDGGDALPGSGGLADLGKGVRRMANKVITGGTGLNSNEATLSVAASAIGNARFRALTGQSANTVAEREDALRMGSGDGTTQGNIKMVGEAMRSEIAAMDRQIDFMPPGPAKDNAKKERARAAAKADAFGGRGGADYAKFVGGHE